MLPRKICKYVVAAMLSAPARLQHGIAAKQWRWNRRENVRRSGMVEADDVLERGQAAQRMRGEPAGHHRALDAAGVVAAIRPVAGERQIVVGIVERRDAV